MMLTFDEDYPSFANITDINFELHPLNNVKVGGLSFNNCVMRINGASRLTFTGLGSDVIHTSTYANAVNATCTQPGSVDEQIVCSRCKIGFATMNSTATPASASTEVPTSRR